MYYTPPVYYEGAGERPDLTIMTLMPQEARKLAGPVLRVMAEAYGRELEGTGRPLPPGSASDFFAPDDRSRVEHQRKRMQAAILGGATYRIAHTGRRLESDDQVVGLIKTSDSRGTLLQKLRLSSVPPNAYVNDIAVSHPHLGIGSALLALSLYPYHWALSSVVADVIPGSEGFFERYGMRPAERQPRKFEPLEIGGVALHKVMKRYEQPYSGTVRRSAVERYPWLASAGPWRPKRS